MRLYRSRAVRTPPAGGPARSPPPPFDPLDSSSSISRRGWRFNDATTEILYAASSESLSILEVAVRPGWENVEAVMVAGIDTGSARIATLGELGIVLPANWNSRPAAEDSRTIAREFLTAIARIDPADRPIGVFVPSVLSTSEPNVLLDPSRKGELTASIAARIPFKTLRESAS